MVTLFQSVAVVTNYIILFISLIHVFNDSNKKNIEFLSNKMTNYTWILIQQNTIMMTTCLNLAVMQKFTCYYCGGVFHFIVLLHKINMLVVVKVTWAREEGSKWICPDGHVVWCHAQIARGPSLLRSDISVFYM